MFYLVIKFFFQSTPTLFTWLQQPTIRPVECSSSLCCYDAEDCPSNGDASRRKM